jgi:hypothetical protein
VRRLGSNQVVGQGCLFLPSIDFVRYSLARWKKGKSISHRPSKPLLCIILPRAQNLDNCLNQIGMDVEAIRTITVASGERVP